MPSEDYQKKLDGAKARAEANRRGAECDRFIMEWIFRQGLGPQALDTPEQRIRDQDSWKSVQKKLGMPVLGSRRGPIWKSAEEITARFNQRWGVDSAWRQKLESGGIPYAARADTPAELWDRIEPVGRVGDLKVWLDSAPGDSALETRGLVLLSLTLYRLIQMEMEEKAKETEAARPNPEPEPQSEWVKQMHECCWSTLNRISDELQNGPPLDPSRVYWPALGDPWAETIKPWRDVDIQAIIDFVLRGDADLALKWITSKSDGSALAGASEKLAWKRFLRAALNELKRWEQDPAKWSAENRGVEMMCCRAAGVPEPEPIPTDWRPEIRASISAIKAALGVDERIDETSNVGENPLSSGADSVNVPENDGDFCQGSNERNADKGSILEAMEKYSDRGVNERIRIVASELGTTEGRVKGVYNRHRRMLEEQTEPS